MSDECPRLFVCDVLPCTRLRAFMRVTAAGLALAAGALWIATYVPFTAPPLSAFAFLVLTSALLPGARANPMLTFRRQYDCVRGVTSPAGTVPSMHWPWFAAPAGIILLVTPSPIWAALLIYCALILFIRQQLRHFVRRTKGVLDELIEVFFVYLAYPDDRYVGVGGTGGLWLASESIRWRTLCTALHITPLYICLGVGAMRWLTPVDASGADTGMPTTIALITLAPLPVVLLFASQLHPLAVYLPARCFESTSSNEWEAAVELVSNSTYVQGDVALADHFFIGWFLPARAAADHPFKTVGKFDLPCRTPALLHRSILKGHIHLLGSSQSGKTSIGLATLLMQLIRGWLVRATDLFGRPVIDGHGKRVWSRSKPIPMLIMDLKGDLALYNTVREECARTGQTLKFFTLNRGMATSYFNALPNLGVSDRLPVEFCELTVNALSLFHGLSYGRSYYSKQSRDLLLKTLKGAPIKPASWHELYELLLREIDPKKHKDIFELVSSIFALAQYPVLGSAPAGVDVIHMPTVFAERQVVFCSLPARLSAISARDVGKLILFAFITAAGDWNERFERLPSVVAVDEIQILCSSNLATLFQQASGAAVSMIFSNQGRLDLNVPDAPHLADSVRINTRFKQMFTVVDPREAADLIQVSGDRLGILRSYVSGRDGKGHATSSVSEQETLCQFLTQNEINAVNNDRNGSLIQVISDAGFTELGGVPRHIQTPYPLEAYEYERRLHTPWPTAPEMAPAPGGVTRTVVNTQEPEEVQEKAEQDYAQLMAFFRQTARRAGRDRMRDWVDPTD